MSELFSYDELPYPSKFFLQTHPDRLATMAVFFGLRPAPVDTCRVLELGCGNGTDLISHAFHLPDAKFVGVDLAVGHIEDAQRGARELGLTNIEFIQMDVAMMTVDEFGEFDYIVAHGLFSWVPQVVRDRVLEIFSEMLAPNGIGYISYNAYPGAHHREMVQRMMRYHSRDVADPAEKVGKAISFLAFLSENASEKEIFGPILQHELQRHFEHEAADIFHDDLSDANRAYYFHEFAAMLAEHELQFLSEAELHAMGTGGLSADAREFVESIDDPIEREQYLDFLRGRIFRQTLFCRADVAVDRDPKPDVIRRFKLASSIRPVSPNPEIASTRVEKFAGAKGMGIQIDDPLAKAALVELGQSWGRAVGFDDLAENAKDELLRRGFESDDWNERLATLEAILFQLCRETSLIELHLFQPEASREAPEMPRVNALARWQLPQANNVLTNLNLDVKIEDPVSRRLLELLDGTRDLDSIEVEMREFINSSEDVEEKSDLLLRLTDWLRLSVSQLAKLGMFESE